MLYDARIPGEEARAEHVGGEILRICMRYGGSITGEHGVGADKACYLGELFGDDDLDDDELRALRVRSGARRSIPTKVFPTPRLCGDRPGRTSRTRPNAAARRAADERRARLAGVTPAER